MLLTYPTERDAMGSDEYHPLTHKGSNFSVNGGIGYTVVDSIDTMHIMGLNDEYVRARRWVEQSLSFDKEGSFSTFEVRSCSSILSYVKADHTDYDPCSRRSSFSVHSHPGQAIRPSRHRARRSPPPSL